MITGTVILADFAEQDNTTGKAHILGAGWTIAGPGPVPHAVVVFLKVPTDMMGQTLGIVLRLTDHSGQTVRIPGLAGEQDLEVAGQILLNEPEERPTDADYMDTVFSLNLGPLLLRSGETYTWQVEAQGKPVATTSFRVRTAVPSEPVQ